VGFFSTCSWLVHVAGVGGYVLVGVEMRSFVLYISLFLRVLGWWVCVCACIRAYTHTNYLGT